MTLIPFSAVLLELIGSGTIGHAVGRLVGRSAIGRRVRPACGPTVMLGICVSAAALSQIPSASAVHLYWGSPDVFAASVM